MKKSFFLLSLLLSLLAACSGGQSSTGAGNPQKGKVIPDVKCRNNPSVSYSLYLPSGYTATVKSPVVLAFDPHGTGELPVEKYRSLAEKYGYILMGSNNSKNGQQMNETESIVNAMFEEIISRYSSDTSRVYMMGFSGGSRIASLVALYAGGVRGVIGCGAGFPGSGQPGRFRFDYIGIAGNADFNMNELVNLDGQLEQDGFRHALVIFDGKHEWPPVSVMDKAFTWNEFCAMKDKKIPEKETLILDFRDAMEKQVAQDATDKDLYKKYDDLKQLVRFTDGLVNTDGYRKEMEAVQKSQEYAGEEKRHQILKDKEMKEQQMFNENFYLKDIPWWKKQITNYELRISKGEDREDVLMCKRIMSYLSLLAYMQYSSANGSGDKEKAGFALEVYRIVDPENAAKIK